MKLAAIAIIVLFSASSCDAGEQPGADWLTRNQVEQNLKQSGYTTVQTLKADDGHWEGKGIKNGQRMEFHVDAHTGAITKEEVDR